MLQHCLAILMTGTRWALSFRRCKRSLATSSIAVSPMPAIVATTPLPITSSRSTRAARSAASRRRSSASSNGVPPLSPSSAISRNITAWAAITSPTGAACGVLQPAQHRRDERYAVPVCAVGDYVQIDLLALGNLAPEIVKRHQKTGREHIGLMLDLTVVTIPTHDILLAAPDSVGVGQPMNEVVAELMPESEVDAPFRLDRDVVENPPAFFTGARAIERAIKSRQGPADDERHGIIRISLRAVL